jgi:cytoskeleton protein RodZ
MTSIGERLRRQRLQNRISIEKVSLDTKIGVRLLEAIEAEQFEKLPGGVFRKSFVLQYARALGLDADEIASDLTQLTEFDEVPAMPTAEMVKASDGNSSARFSFRGDWIGFSGSTLGSLIAAVGVIMACALIYSWWQAPRQEAAVKAEPASARPAASRQAASQPAPAQNQGSAQAASQPVSAPNTTAPQAVVAPPSGDGKLVRVDLSADEKTWVSISSDGKNVFANALEAHETKVVEASQKVRLLIGNAGGLEVSLNGKPIGPIGPKGQIRVVELTPAGFQIVPRKPPTVEPL